MMLALEASETSAKIENKPQANSLKKVFNESSDSGCESLRKFINVSPIHIFHTRFSEYNTSIHNSKWEQPNKWVF